MELKITEHSLIDSAPMVDAALAYAARGIPVFPLKAAGKLPLTVRGFKDATTNTNTIRAWWKSQPLANIGIPTGERSGWAVIDIDARHGGNESFAALIEKNGQIPDTAESQTGGGGRHLIFKFVEGFRNSAGRLGKGIDTRGEGGYIVAPPSIHESGALYAWEASSDPEDVPLADLPEWLNPDRAKPSQLATGNLIGVEPAAVAKANGSPVEEGGRNMAAASLAGQYISAGDSVSDVMKKVKDWNELNPAPLPVAEIERTVASVARTHISKHPGSEIRVGDLQPEAAATTRSEPEPFPDELLNPPGLVGELCRWINETAIKPQPILALGNSIAFVGAVIGRKVKTPTDLRSNIYALGVGESGCGKDHSRKCIKRICKAAGLTGDLLGGEEVSSDSALLASVCAHPSILFQFDEIGHFLTNANSKYAAVHQRNIAPTFTKLFSSANTTFIGKEYSGRDRADIEQPNVCLYGTTVPERLYDGLTDSEIRDGFLGRMLVFQSGNADPIEQDIDPKTIPPTQSIVQQVQSWVSRNDLPRAEGNIASVIEHIPILVNLEPGADGVFQHFKTVCTRRKAEIRSLNVGGLDALWSRAMEHSLKVALIIACGCEYSTPIIGQQVAEWSVKLVEYLVGQLVETVKNSVAGSDHHRDLLAVLRVIRAAGPKGVSRSNLCRSTQKLRRNQRDEILSQLLEQGDIAKRETQLTRGPKGTEYVTI